MNPETKGEEKITEIEPHNRYMQIRLTEAEYEAINRKFHNSGSKSRSDFFRHIIFTGYIVIFNYDKMNELLKLTISISNNFNQVAFRANKREKFTMKILPI